MTHEHSQLDQSNLEFILHAFLCAANKVVRMLQKQNKIKRYCVMYLHMSLNPQVAKQKNIIY